MSEIAGRDVRHFNAASLNNGTTGQLPVHDLEFVAMALQRILPPVFIFCGLILNIIAFAVLRGEPFRKVSVFVIMRAYACSCVVVLLVETGTQWILMVVGVPYIADWNEEICRVWSFFINVVTHVPGWLVVAMVMDRYLHIVHSSRAPHICSVFVATVTVISVVLGVGTISIHAMWSFEIHARYSFDMSAERGQQCGVWKNGLMWALFTDSFFYFLPQILILIFDGVILGRCCLRGCYRSVTMRDGSLSNRDSAFMVVLLSLVYFVFMMPACAIKITLIKTVTEHSGQDVVFLFFELLSQMLIIACRVVSPFLIVVASKVGRREFARALKSISCASGNNVNNVNRGRCAGCNLKDRSPTESDESTHIAVTYL